MRFASAIEPLRCAARASSNSCSGVECPTASFVLKRKPHSIGLPVISVLDIETRCSIKLHIDDRTGKLDFVYRAWPLEQGPVTFMTCGIDHSLTRRRSYRYNRPQHGWRIRDG